MNLAAAWKLPLCFFIENNRYAVRPSVEESTGRATGCRRAAWAFAIPAWKVDGMDPWPCTSPMEEAARRACAPATGPTIIEADVYRYLPPERRAARQRLRLPQQG